MLLFLVRLDVHDLTFIASLTVAGAESFNGDLSGWDVSSVKDMSNTFWKAKSVSNIQCQRLDKCLCTLFTNKITLFCVYDTVQW